MHRKTALSALQQLRDIEDVIIKEVGKNVESKALIDGGILTEKLI
jgi:hypothetical protein